MEKKMMVSVIVPVYKAEKFIAKCIESILGQTYKNLELILVDDGSPDRSGEICDEYAAKDNRIRVIHTDNHGVSHARNTGLDRATGEYVCFVDSDDWVSPDYIQNLIPEQGEDLVHGGYVHMAKGEMTKKAFFQAHTASRSQWRENFEENWSQGALMAPWGNSYKRAILEEHHIRFPTDLDIAEDMVFNLEYLIHCELVRYHEQCDYFYRVDNGDSLMNRHHECRTRGLIEGTQAKERIAGKPEYHIRWQEWGVALAHHRKWKKLSKGSQKKTVIRCLKKTYRTPYFRESIPFIRKHGTLDEKVETFFMNRFLHPMYPGFYKIIAGLSRLKRR